MIVKNKIKNYYLKYNNKNKINFKKNFFLKFNIYNNYNYIVKNIKLFNIYHNFYLFLILNNFILHNFKINKYTGIFYKNKIDIIYFNIKSLITLF